MNDREKSDVVIVAMKLTNKAGEPAAESVEPRAATNGNADQQTTRRAQDRESVSHALDRIRQVARLRKQERFTSLFHHLNLETLRTAFYALRRDAAPGVDGLTWRAYEADLDHLIENLRDRLQRGAYRASPHSGSTYQSWTDANARSPSPPLRIKLSKERRSRCSTRSTRKTSSGSRMVSGPDAASTMRWTHSRSGPKSER